MFRSLLQISRRSSFAPLAATRLSRLRFTTSVYNFSSFSFSGSPSFRIKPTKTSFCPSPLHCLLSTTASRDDEGNRKEHDLLSDEATEEEVEPIEEWEEDDDSEAELGDGGAGGGIALQGVPWGERALAIAREVLSQFGDDIKLYAFKTTPSGYIYVRLDKTSHEYGCPSMEELESYSRGFKKRLDDAGAVGEIPDDLALEVSSPGAQRILNVPDDLCRFKDMAMRVCYDENMESSMNCQEKSGVFLLDSIETESENCIWKLANVKENRDPQSKGRPFSRKQKDWRLKLPFAMHRKITLYLDH